MLTPEIQSFLERACAHIRSKYHLDRVYLAQCFGKRRHFLAGDGAESFGDARQLPLNESIALFWQGDLSAPEQKTIKAELQGTVEKLERTLHPSL
jgi:hypothetical protein